MSLYDTPEHVTNTMPDEHLINLVTNYLIAAMQAADWEPSGHRHSYQFFTKGERTVAIGDTLVMKP